MNKILLEMESEALRKDHPEFKVGDTLAIHQRIIEGDKERVQIFTGTVIGRRGRGLSATFALYRYSYGSGIERIFPLHSPLISKIDVVKRGKVRKSKLFYLRGASGKMSKVKELIAIGGEEQREVAAAEPPPAAT
jgi:large subunit ribosomal protein L19